MWWQPAYREYALCGECLRIMTAVWLPSGGSGHGMTVSRVQPSAHSTRIRSVQCLRGQRSSSAVSYVLTWRAHPCCWLIWPCPMCCRQDPVECIFSFICSSNNNIPRITLMLSKLRRAYGELLLNVGDGGLAGMEIFGNSEVGVCNLRRATLSKLVHDLAYKEDCTVCLGIPEENYRGRPILKNSHS